MRPVAQTSTFSIAIYTIRQQPLFDNPHQAIFLVFLREKLIGRQISYPCLSDCQWHEAQRGIYAQRSRSFVSYRDQQTIRRGGRPTKDETARRKAQLEQYILGRSRDDQGDS